MRLRSLALGLGLLVLLGGSVAMISSPAFSFPINPNPLPSSGGTVTEAVQGKVGILNPLFPDNDSSREVSSMIYQGLTAVSADQSLVPQLAARWALSEDRLVYTFDLRTDVRWADGARFTADDVLFTFSILKDPSYSQPTALNWRDVTVEPAAVDQVRFKLKAPSSSFLLLLSTSAPSSFGILPKHLFNGNRAALAVQNDPHSLTHATGTGPFMVDSISKDHGTIRLKRNPFAKPRPYLDSFVFRSYPTLDDAADAVYRGEADAVGGLQPQNLPGLSRRPKVTVKDSRTFQLVAVLFNLGSDTLLGQEPKEVRQALVQAVDRRRVIADAVGGFADPAPGPIPPTDWAFSKELSDRLPFDPRAAAKTLDQAGWTLSPQAVVRSKGGRELKFSLVAADVLPYSKVAESVSQQLRQIGVDVAVDKVPLSKLVSGFLLHRHYQMALAQFEDSPEPDPYAYWHSGQAEDSVDLAHLPRQSLIDKDLEDGRSYSGKKDRKLAYDDFQDLMADAAPGIFLYEPHYEYAVANRVRGLRMNPVIQAADRFQFVAEWYVIAKRF